MNIFELCSEKEKKGQNGRREFKAILYQIHPDDCIDTQSEVGTQYNANGITWIREYCERALPSIQGMSLRCSFLDEERTELEGHGDTDIIDGIPIYEDAVVIGTFKEGYIDEIELPNGQRITACIGVGEIDSSCYNNLCQKLDKDISEGVYPKGSIEIMRTSDNKSIVYKYGYKDYGRIPTEFIHSGYALIGVTPSDSTAQLVELNQQKEEKNTMTPEEIKKLMEDTISAYISEENRCRIKTDEMNELILATQTEKDEAVAESQKIQKALDDAKAELSELYKKQDELYGEVDALRKQLSEAQSKERIREMNAAIEKYSDEEKAYAKAQIDAFMENPIECEINSVTDAILIGIGKKAKEDAAIAAENNSFRNDLFDDIFGAVDTTTVSEDNNIF